MRRKMLSLMLSAAMVASVLTGCGSDDGTGSSTPVDGSQAESQGGEEQGDGQETGGEGELHLLYSSEVSTLNYLKTSSISEMEIPANTIDTLVETDNKGNLVPALATEWSQDGLVWTFKLREGVKWIDHTGAEVAEVTAQDFVDAMKYQLTPEYEAANARNFFGVIANAEEYYMGLVGSDEEGNTYEPIDFSEVGVKAVDTYTLEYTLAGEVPYFLSSLVYVTYMPAYGPLLEEKGASFATAADSMYYCGAYYLSEYEPQVRQVLTRNPLYWDAEHVYITRINSVYNAEKATLAPEMVKRGEIDEASIGADILDDWLAGDQTKDLVSKERPSTDVSYFYCFNFNPAFGEEYEPENWKKAVNNENFRQAVMAAMNRRNPMAINEPNDPEQYIQNTITPATFTVNASGVDYVDLGAFQEIVGSDSFDETAAASYRDAARTELAAENVTFPVKMLVKYNPNVSNWDKECAVLEQQIEGVLGADFIDIIVEAGPSESFLTVRREGNYAFLKCNWGADYADPETWTDPFYQAEGSDGYKYAFLRTAISENTAAADTVKEYFGLVEAAKAITADAQKDERYHAFAKAEAYLIDHALVIPYGISVSDYIATRLNVFEGQYASCGTVPNLRYKGHHLLDHFVSLEEYNKNLENQ